MKTTFGKGLIIALSVFSFSAIAAENSDMISEQEAIKAALSAVDVEVLGIRHDEPDNQWDVFVKVGDKAYEVEVDASTAMVVAAEEETLSEIQAELSGNLSHEGVDGDVDK